MDGRACRKVYRWFVEYLTGILEGFGEKKSVRGFPLRSVSGFASSGVTSLFFDWTTFDVLARVRMNHNAYQDDIPATHFFLMFYVPCQLTSETTERKPGASDNYSLFFFNEENEQIVSMS